MMQSPNKKTSLIEFFYIALLLTATRPPDHSLLGQRYSRYNNNHLFQFGNPNENGQLLVEDNYFYDEIRSIHLNRFSYDRHFNSKSSILLQETLDVLEDINSLGRYSQIINRPSSNLIAFPVSNGFSNHNNDVVKQEDESLQQQSPIPTINSNSDHDDLDLDDIYHSDIWENLNDDPLIQADDDYLNQQQSLSIKTEDADDDENCNSDRLISLLDENGNNIDNVDNGILTEASFLSPSSTILDNYLLNESVMLPILETPVNSDVNDMFGQLELLLSNETDNYGGQEWSTTTTTPYSTATVAAVTNENVAEFPIYDAIPVSNVYDSNNGQIIQTTNSAVPQYSNNNNFGSVLYSSLQTLSNGGQDHLNSDLAATNSIYNGHTASESSYLSNGSSSFNTNNHNLSTDCFYNGGSNGGYVEDINLANNYTNNNNNNNVNLNGGQHFDQYHSLTASTPIHNQKFTTNPSNTEDCFDKSSDSAVSSMSSDRVQSLSDNDLIETSSESSSYHCDGNMNLDKSHAQKKYHLFGKNKIQDEKNETIENSENNVPEYYPDYYIYSNPIQCPIMEANENYNQNYYPSQQQQATTIVQHNHTYAQQPIAVMMDLEQSMNSITVTDSIPSQTEWLNSESIKIEQTSDDGTSTIQQRQQQRKERKTVKIENQEQNHDNNHHDRDYHFNRDEKRARALNIPISTHDIINLPIDEFNEKLTKYELTEIQLSLIRDIRRRGKNKVAAQNCRKRKMDQILGLQSEVDTMYSQKEQLENHYNQLLMMREMARDKYTKLYQFVVEASASRQTFFELSSSPPDFPVKDSSTNEIMINDDSSNHRFMVSTGANLTTISSTPSTYGNGGSGSTLGDLGLTNGFNDNNNNNNHQQKMNH